MLLARPVCDTTELRERLGNQSRRTDLP